MVKSNWSYQKLHLFFEVYEIKMLQCKQESNTDNNLYIFLLIIFKS